ncbi:alpha-ketoglutarate-dependent dioxygenase AlkB family protein [Microbulbifer taiwanensis]|uniref:Alpha-ketoglutarate-dependent dioxygenase AlkB family protein n=1 Tax=Microbulbifer taiwanensis TaxID=986746 RepID=A0ABW1YW64_9GAMM|nr:alpha-ketoglutarate-dependent dioxygenase AlkB [Microbulbifer taiwanensis]
MNEQTFSACAADLAEGFPDAEWIDLSPGRALLIPDWLTSSESAAIYRACLAQLPWEQPEVRLFGRQHPIPRRHAFVGDPDVIYRWSGLEQRPHPWIDSLVILRSRLTAAGFPFNSMLANHYRGGADSMGWHADNERELGDWPVVATVSLGQERRLGFKRRDGAGRLSLDLPDASLLLTSGAVQHHWLHGIGKSARKMEERISLTFRYINGRYIDS